MPEKDKDIYINKDYDKSQSTKEQQGLNKPDIDDIDKNDYDE